MSDPDLDEALTAAIWGLWARTDEPSLWAQLRAAGATSGAAAGGSSSGPRSKPPMGLDALSLVQEITTTLADELDGSTGYAHAHDNYRGVLHVQPPPAGLDPFRNAIRLARRYLGWSSYQLDLIHRLTTWTDQANRLLGNVARRLEHVRGACAECGERTITGRGPDAVVRPVIRVLWSDGRIIALDCAHCGHVYPVTGHGLQGLAERHRHTDVRVLHNRADLLPSTTRR